MKTLIPLFLFSLLAPFSQACGAYGAVDTYTVKIVDAEGMAIAGQSVTVEMNGKTEELTSDAWGYVDVAVNRFSPCPVGKGPIKRLFLKDDWVPEDIRFTCNGKTTTIKKNWRRYFRSDKRKVDHYDISKGKLIGTFEEDLPSLSSLDHPTGIELLAVRRD